MAMLMMNRKEELNIRGLLKGPVSPALIARILRIGIPSGLEGAAFHIGKIMVQSLVASLGTSAIAINAVVGNFNAYANIPGNGINLAMITIIGQCRGQNNIAAVPICRLCLFMCFAIWPLAFTIPNMLKAVGDVRFILLASFSSMWLCRVGGAYLFVRFFGMGVEGIWYAMYLDWAFRGILYSVRVLHGRWVDKKVI